MSPPPTVIIVNFNSGAHLERCLSAVAACGLGMPVVVVDNASQDGSEHIALRFPDVTLVRNATNVGFGAGVNRGAAAATGAAWLLLLNPDCELTGEAVEALVGTMTAHADCAVAAPCVLEADGRIQGNARGDPTMLTGLFGRSTVLSRLLPHSAAARRNVPFRDDAVYSAGTASHLVDWVSGACMLVRRDAFDAVGGFDERYFLYWEDADLCRRLRARGHSIRYVPGAKVVHVGGASSRTARALSTRAFHRSAFIYYATHVARSPVSRAVAWCLLAVRGRWKLMTER